MRPALRISLTFVLLMSLGGICRAQTSTSRLFVEGAVFADQDVLRNRNAAPTVGGAGTIGFRFTRHFSVRFDAEMPALHHYTYPTDNSALFRFSESVSFKTTTYGAMFAGHIPAGKRIDIALLAGLGGSLQDTRTTVSEDTLDRSGRIVRHDDITRNSVFRGSAFTVGADVALQLTPHLALVPEIRTHVYNEYQYAVRPKLALRWTF